MSSTGTVAGICSLASPARPAWISRSAARENAPVVIAFHAEIARICGMNKSEILAELPRLNPADREEVLERLCELQDFDLIHGAGPTEEEKKLLDDALSEFERDGDAGKPWRDVLRELRSAGRS